MLLKQPVATQPYAYYDNIFLKYSRYLYYKKHTLEYMTKELCPSLLKTLIYINFKLLFKLSNHHH